jgi:hypothetical protein
MSEATSNAPLTVVLHWWVRGASDRVVFLPTRIGNKRPLLLSSA